MANRRSKRPRASSPVPLSSILPSLAHLNLSAKLREYKVTKAWPECVGEAIARKASPERLMGTVLYCNVANSAWMTEMNYQKAGIIDRLNASIGYKAITEIMLRIGPVRTAHRRRQASAPVQWKELTDADRAFIDEVTTGIKDERLKNLIKRVIGKSRE